MTLHSWFPTSLYSESITSPLKVQREMVRYVDRYYEKNAPIPKENGGVLVGDDSGDSKVYQKAEFSWLNKQIFSRVEKYLDALGVDINKIKIYASKAWPIVVEKGGKVLRHKHPNSILSAVFYLQTGDEESGEIRFYASHSEIDFLPMKFKRNGRSYTNCKYKAKPNDLLIFPSTLEHEVETYNGELPRYSISYDIIVTSTRNDDWESTIPHPSQWKELNSS